MIVLHADLRALKYCNRGARLWFTEHGLDWGEFLKWGIAEEALLATRDQMATDVVAQAYRRAGDR